VLRYLSFVIEDLSANLADLRTIQLKQKKTRALRFERGSWSVPNGLSGPFHVRRFGATYHQLSAKELLIMEFLHGAARLFDSRHLDKSESFRTLCVFVADNLGISDLADSVEEFE
jgi:hypothetical protein